MSASALLKLLPNHHSEPVRLARDPLSRILRQGSFKGKISLDDQRKPKTILFSNYPVGFSIEIKKTFYGPLGDERQHVVFLVPTCHGSPEKWWGVRYLGQRDFVKAYRYKKQCPKAE